MKIQFGSSDQSSYLWVLLVLQVLVDGGVEVLGVTLVEAVDLPFLLDLYVPLNQDELADGLKKRI